LRILTSQLSILRTESFDIFFCHYIKHQVGDGLESESYFEAKKEGIRSLHEEVS